MCRPIFSSFDLSIHLERLYDVGLAISKFGH